MELFNWRTRTISSGVGPEKNRFYLYGKKFFLYNNHQALQPLIKRDRCNKQYSARLTWWLDRLAHFNISIQQILGNNLKFSRFFSPKSCTTTENTFDEQHVKNILTEQAELSLTTEESSRTNHNTRPTKALLTNTI